MRYKLTVKGLSPIIMHDAQKGLDVRHEWKLEINTLARKKGSNRTEVEDARIRELETALSFWFDEDKNPTIPPDALRRAIEDAAKKTKQGTLVREGLTVLDARFIFDQEKYGSTLEEWSRKCQFPAVVRNQQSRIIRTRARFIEWGCEFTIDTDPADVDRARLEEWIKVAGNRIGLGDWRPQKSGRHGRFEMVSLEELGE